jgi:hypothetical protein
MYLYLYSIVEPETACPPFPTGINGTRVFSQKYGDIAVLLGDIRTSKIRPERRHLKLHEEVVREFMKRGTVLPVSYGTIAQRMEIAHLMEHNHKALRANLTEFSGKVETHLKLVWDVDNIYKYFLEQHPELQEEATTVFSRGMPSQWEKIELGKLFEELLKEEREKYVQKVEKALSSYCNEIKELNVADERNILRLACLIDRGEEQGFDEGIRRIAKDFNDIHSFEITGPWSLYNFCNIHLAVPGRGRRHVFSR